MATVTRDGVNYLEELSSVPLDPTAASHMRDVMRLDQLMREFVNPLLSGVITLISETWLQPGFSRIALPMKAFLQNTAPRPSKTTVDKGHEIIRTELVDRCILQVPDDPEEHRFREGNTRYMAYDLPRWSDFVYAVSRASFVRSGFTARIVYVANHVNNPSLKIAEVRHQLQNRHLDVRFPDIQYLVGSYTPEDWEEDPLPGHDNLGFHVIVCETQALMDQVNDHYRRFSAITVPGSIAVMTFDDMIQRVIGHMEVMSGQDFAAEDFVSSESPGTPTKRKRKKKKKKKNNE